MNQERIQTLQKLLQMDPSDIFTRYALGLEYVQDQPDQALQHFRAVVEAQPDYVPGYFQAGRLEADRGNTEDARSWLERGLAVAERVGDWHAHGEIQEALDEL